MDHHGKTMYIIRSWWHEAKFSSISPQAQRSPAILTSFFPAGAVDWFPSSTNPHIHIISVGYNLHFGWSNPILCCLCHTISDGKIKMFGAKIITFHRKTLISMAKTTTFGWWMVKSLHLAGLQKFFWYIFRGNLCIVPVLVVLQCCWVPEVPSADFTKEFLCVFFFFFHCPLVILT